MMDNLLQLLHSDLGSTVNNFAILIFRILFSVQLLRVHGLKKLSTVSGKEPEQLPNPLGLPDKLNARIAALADTVVPFFIILGFLGRLTILPTIGVTAIGYFVVHRNDPNEVRDIPFMYTICLLLLLVTGPGSFSLDQYIFHLLNKN